MQKYILIFSGVAILILGFTSSPKKYKLQEAIRKNLVSVKAKSLGKYQGESIALEIKNLSKENFELNIEPGRRLMASENKYQDILVVKEEKIIVNAGATVKRNITGFCCESNDSGPKENLLYKPNVLADSNLVKLAEYISKNYTLLNTTSIQQAIWSVSNAHATAAINVSNEKEQTLKYLVCAIKNEPIPWYTIKQRIYQLGNGHIYLCNDSLNGKFQYSNNEWCYSKLNVYDKSNNAVMISIGNWLKPGTNNTFNLDLAVSKLGKGKYKVCLENDKQIFTQKEFEI